MTFYEYLRLLGIRYTKLGKNEPWEIFAAPIIVSVVVDSIIPDRLVEKW